MANVKKTDRVCDLDRFPMVQIKGHWECVAEHLDRCIELVIGDLPLKPDDTTIVLFDFGDHWESHVALERIKPRDASLGQPTVLETYGQAPEQYPDGEECGVWRPRFRP